MLRCVGTDDLENLDGEDCTVQPRHFYMWDKSIKNRADKKRPPSKNSLEFLLGIRICLFVICVNVIILSNAEKKYKDLVITYLS